MNIHNINNPSLRRRIYELKKELWRLQLEYADGEVDYWYNTDKELFIIKVTYDIVPGQIIACGLTGKKYRLTKMHSYGKQYQKWFAEPVTE